MSLLSHPLKEFHINKYWWVCVYWFARAHIHAHRVHTRLYSCIFKNDGMLGDQSTKRPTSKRSIAERKTKCFRLISRLWGDRRESVWVYSIQSFTPSEDDERNSFAISERNSNRMKKKNVLTLKRYAGCQLRPHGQFYQFYMKIILGDE